VQDQGIHIRINARDTVRLITEDRVLERKRVREAPMMEDLFLREWLLEERRRQVGRPVRAAVFAT
jgi:hypothetical protein